VNSVDKILKDELSIEFDWNMSVNFIKDRVDALGYMQHDHQLLIPIFPANMLFWIWNM
jgi:hypothetical protein